MKKISQYILYIFLAQLTFVNTSIGQTPATKIEYTCTYNSMFGRGVSYKNYHAILLMQGDQSFFTMKADPENKQDSHLVMADLESDSLFTVFKDLESNSLLFEVNDMNQHSLFYADTLYPMHWDLIEEEKSISSIPCKKAKTFFKGRLYTAWYATSIPVINGPWKLGGLPGLILEAYDEEDNWHIQYVSSQNIPNVHFEKFDKMMHNSIAGYQGYVSEVKKIFKRASQFLASQQTGNCLTCQTKSALKLHTWESID